jgi:hypothetical protein
MKKIFVSILFLPFAVFAADTNALPALAPAYPEIPPTFIEQHKVALVIAGFLFIIGQCFWLYKMMSRTQPPVERPENLARAELERLSDEPEDGRTLSQISLNLRRYFGAVFAMPGEQATTAEFITGLDQHEKINPELREKAASFLRECDARKFSSANIAAPLNAAERALDLVNEAEALRVKQNATNA